MDVGPSGQKESASETEKDEHADEMAFTDNKTSDPEKSFNKYVRRRNTKILPVFPNKRQKKQLLVQIPGVIKVRVTIVLHYTYIMDWQLRQIVVFLSITYSLNSSKR